MSPAERSIRSKTQRSLVRYERSCRTLAGGVSTALRRSARPYPLFFERGAGSHVWDVDGNEYIDYGLAWGPLILGHSPETVVEAVRAQALRGLTFGAQHDLEFEVSELLTEIIPCADLVAYANSGTEIVQVALRLARAVTGRTKYLKFEGHYHGWSDQALVSYKPAASDPTDAPVAVGKGQLPHDHVAIAQWNNRESVERAFEQHDISAVMCEPLLANSGCIPPEPGFLEFLREVCTRRGALLIFDEVITGLRLDLGGAQSRFGVVPDLATFAKAVGAGAPLSVLAGRRDFMNLIATGEVVHAGTLNGNPLALAAANAAIAHLKARRAEIYPRIRGLGEKLAAGLTRIIPGSVATGDGPVFTLHLQWQMPHNYRDTLAADRQAYSDFALFMLDSGIIVLPDARWYISAAHTEQDIALTLAAAQRYQSSLMPN